MPDELSAAAPEGAFVPDPTDEKQVDALARALFEMDKVNWVAPDYSQHETYMRGWARCALTALAALARTPAAAPERPEVEALRSALTELLPFAEHEAALAIPRDYRERVDGIVGRARAALALARTR